MILNGWGFLLSDFTSVRGVGGQSKGKASREVPGHCGCENHPSKGLERRLSSHRLLMWRHSTESQQNCFLPSFSFVTWKSNEKISRNRSHQHIIIHQFGSCRVYFEKVFFLSACTNYLCTGCFVCQPDTSVTWEEGISLEKTPLRSTCRRVCKVLSLLMTDVGGPSYCGWYHAWAGGPGF